MIRCQYQIQADDLETARLIARAIAIEQTVEVPEGLITTALEAELVGQIHTVEDAGDGKSYFALLDYHAAQAAGQLPQLLNLIYGNSSINPAVKLLDALLPATVRAQFPGPNYGVPGLRKMLGVYERPLVCGVLKPRGTSTAKFAALAEAMALGGIDLVKDDHNLVFASFEDFAERVRKCQAAVERGNAITGRCCLYFPYISAPVEEIPRYLEEVLQCDVRGILIGPTVMGLDFVRALAQQYPLFLMAHPTLTGPMYLHDTNGMSLSFYLGTLLRMIGIDASIFTTFGGRFPLSRQECIETAACLRRPAGSWERSWATPAGGMQFEKIGELCLAYGADTILLIGGALLERQASLEAGTAEFTAAVRSHFTERLEAPAG